MSAFLRFNLIALSLLLALAACGVSPQAKKAGYLANGDKFFAMKQYKEAATAYRNALRADSEDKNTFVKLAAVFLAAGDINQYLSNLQQARDIDPGDLDIRLKMARGFAMIHKTNESRREIDFILEKDPQHPGALILLSELAAKPEEIEDAVSRLKSLQPGPKELPGVKLALGKLYAGKGDLTNAENYLLDALKAANLPEAHLALGDVAFTRKDFALAEQEYRAAAKLLPEVSSVQLKLADFYIFRKNNQTATVVLENILLKSPDLRPALYRLARIALENKKLDECGTYLQTALQKNPSDLEGRAIHAQLLLARGETTQAAGELEEVVKALPNAPFPKFLLGLAYMKKGDAFRAITSVQKAVDLEPNFIPALLLLAEANLRTGAFRSASDNLLEVLEKDAGNVEAYILLPEAARTSVEIEEAEKLLEKGQPFFKDNPGFNLAMGSLYLKKGDLTKAEDSIKKAFSLEPDSALAHVLMGDCLLRKKDHDGAALEYKKAVELSPTASMAHIKLAEFYLIDNNLAEAKRILSESVAKSPDFLPASFYLARMAFAENDFDGSTKLLDAILQKNANYIDALILRGQINGARKKTAEALNDFKEALRINPGSELALQFMGLTYLERADIADARSSFREVVRLDPDLYDPRVRLAELDLRSGDFQSAIDNVQALLGKGVKEPVLYLLLGSGYLGKQDPVKAEEALQTYLEKSPGDARGKYLLGLALRGQGKKAEAVRYFEETLNASPPVMDSLAQLVSIDIADKNLDSALHRVAKQIEISPGNAELYGLLGRVHIVRKEMDQAEAAYLKAIEIDPKLVQVYMDLAQVYSVTKKFDKSLVKLDEVIKLDPKNIGALMLSGILRQKEGDIPGARGAYEAVVALNPGFVPAANNLAYLYCEYLGDTDKAVRLAKTAREIDPDNPNIADTLGWALYKQSHYEWALTYLQGSAAKLPDSAEVLFHLGMVQYQLGAYPEAKQSLSRALEKGGEFRGASEARSALEQIAVNSEQKKQ